MNSAAKTIPAAVISDQSIHVGETRTFSHLRPGDSVSCLGRADSIDVKVPRPSVGATTSIVWDRRLMLRLGPAPHGRISAQCKVR